MIASGFYNGFDKPIKYLKKSLKFLHKKRKHFYFSETEFFSNRDKIFFKKTWSTQVEGCKNFVLL